MRRKFLIVKRLGNYYLGEEFNGKPAQLYDATAHYQSLTTAINALHDYVDEKVKPEIVYTYEYDYKSGETTTQCFEEY